MNGKRNNQIVVRKETEKTQTIHSTNIFIADETMQTNRIIAALRKMILLHIQDIGDAGFVSVRYGMGRGMDDRISIFVVSENEDNAKDVTIELELK